VNTSLKQGIRRFHPWDIVRFIAHLPNFVKLFGRLLLDRRVSLLPKLLLVGAAVYVATPLDFLPDFIPLVGELDDLGILALACRFFFQLCPGHVVQEHVSEIDRSGQWAPFAQQA
jgi:uncharacterized membrane protein YkvA (DUF1232 family)